MMFYNRDIHSIFFFHSERSNSATTDTDSSARNTYPGSSLFVLFSQSSHILFVRLAHRQLYIWRDDVMKEMCQADPCLDTLHSSVCSNRIRCRVSQAESKPRGPLGKADHRCLHWREILEISIYSCLYPFTVMCESYHPQLCRVAPLTHLFCVKLGRRRSQMMTFSYY